MIKIWLKTILLFSYSFTMAQQTVGLFQNEPNSSPGYTLFSPILGTDVYIIDDCGEVVHKWDLTTKVGLMSYLMDDGSLLRTERLGSSFNAGGNGGRLTIYDWDGNQTWQYDIASPSFHAHHDVAILPNGNILAIVWEAFTSEEVIEMGRNPGLTDDDLWMEKIIELKPISSNEAEEVWSWHLVDHLVQDFDSSKDNFGSVEEHPEKMNLNFNGGGSFPLGNNQDWVHFNGIDYNDELDQILLSSRHFSEAWIIDHSTTTEEAATDSGGNSGKGGSILYRWGNPRTYNRGGTSDQQFYLQHDATWVKLGENQDWGISVYNNGTGRPGPDFSQVDLIKLPILPDNNYEIFNSLPYAPLSPQVTIDEINGETFFNTNISGTTLLPNGNALICVGGVGTFSEIDTSTLERVWHYVVPLAADQPVIQGETTSSNSVFKVRRYDLDFIGFENRDLTPQGPIELDPFPSVCLVSTNELKPNLLELKVSPNPTNEFINIEGEFSNETIFNLYNLWGQLIKSQQLINGQRLMLSDLSSGVYFLKTSSHKAVRIIVKDAG